MSTLANFLSLAAWLVFTASCTYTDHGHEVRVDARPCYLHTGPVYVCNPGVGIMPPAGWQVREVFVIGRLQPLVFVRDGVMNEKGEIR